MFLNVSYFFHIKCGVSIQNTIFEQFSNLIGFFYILIFFSRNTSMDNFFHLLYYILAPYLTGFMLNKYLLRSQEGNFSATSPQIYLLLPCVQSRWRHGQDRSQTTTWVLQSASSLILYIIFFRLVFLIQHVWVVNSNLRSSGRI